MDYINTTNLGGGCHDCFDNCDTWIHVPIHGVVRNVMMVTTTQANKADLWVCVQMNIFANSVLY